MRGVSNLNRDQNEESPSIVDLYIFRGSEFLNSDLNESLDTMNTQTTQRKVEKQQHGTEDLAINRVNATKERLERGQGQRNFEQSIHRNSQKFEEWMKVNSKKFDQWMKTNSEIFVQQMRSNYERFEKGMERNSQKFEEYMKRRKEEAFEQQRRENQHFRRQMKRRMTELEDQFRWRGQDQRRRASRNRVRHIVQEDIQYYRERGEHRRMSGRQRTSLLDRAGRIMTSIRLSDLIE